MASNWIGFACSFAPYGPVQWRLPLGIQIPWGIIMFVGLLTFMPNSPRRDLHSDDVHREFEFMLAQINYEKEREITSYREIFRLFRHRVLV
jgi:hypothetical protein